MKENRVFWIFEIFLFLIMGIIALLEIFNFELFEKIFNYLQTPISWFIGLSFGFVFSNVVGKISIKSLKKGNEEKINKRKELFSLFLLNLIIMATVTASIKSLAISFFNNFFIYFHVLFLQWMMVIYLSFKLKNKYEISEKYFLTNELIVLIYTAIILFFLS